MTEAAPLPEFVPFPKIPRLFREVVITEKIDGTNAGIRVAEDGTVTAASRSRWITPEKDNMGFARWVAEHAEELRGLGPGMHWGEWWGSGIQRGYGLKEKRFSLFNVGLWSDFECEARGVVRPACCGVVPVLYRGEFDTAAVNVAIDKLVVNGSSAVPGFMDPEGVVVFHVASSKLYKVTCRNDAQAKGGER